MEQVTYVLDRLQHENPVSVLNETFVGQEEMTLWNPLGLTWHAWIGFVVLKAVGVVVIDPILLAVCKLAHADKLPARVPTPIMKGLETLLWKDYLYLLINQVIEAIGTMYFAYLVFFEAEIKSDVASLTVGNTVGFIYFVFLVDDLIYYWAHRAMHLPALYPWIHKHHHRQSMPKRGYFDAANENPMEQIIGLSIVLLTFRLALLYYPFGVHSLSILAFTFLYAITAFLNHTEYDIQFGLLGLGYTVRSHEMHHRFPTCNYAQNTMLWDKLLGTYQDYRDGHKKTD